MVFTLKSPAKGYKTVMFLVIPPLIGLSPQRAVHVEPRASSCEFKKKGMG